MSTRPRWIPIVLVLLASALAASAGEVFGLKAYAYPAPALPEATQAWSSVTGKQLLCEAGDQLLIPLIGPMKVVGIEKRAPQAWTIREKGHLKTWKTSQKGDTLQVETSGETTVYRRLDSVPREGIFKTLSIGPAQELPRERVSAISKEILERVDRDQAGIEAAKDKYLLPTSDIMVQNTEYLKSLIREIGWIDGHRFGDVVSGNTIILVKHSEDLSLMVGVLPFVERDFNDPGKDNVMRAILYDGLQIDLGRKQRYGTQLGKDAAGNPMVLPLEDPSKVEQFRKEIGLPPLAEYLKLASEGLYSGKPIRMPHDDE